MIYSTGMGRSKTVIIFIVSLILVAVGYSIANFRNTNPAKDTNTAIKEKTIPVVEVKRLEKVVTNKNLTEYTPAEGGDVSSAVDGLPNTWWYASMLPQESTFIELPLKKSEVISKIEISFMDRYATGFVIYFKHENDWVSIKEVSDNKSESIEVSIDKEKQISTPAVKIVFFKTSASDNLVSIREVRLFRPLISP